MTDDTRKDEFIKRLDEVKENLTQEETFRYDEVLEGWHKFVQWLGKQNDPEEILKCLVTEVTGKARSVYIDRLRTRYNKRRALYDLRELERYTGQIVSINHLGRRR